MDINTVRGQWAAALATLMRNAAGRGQVFSAEIRLQAEMAFYMGVAVVIDKVLVNPDETTAPTLVAWGEELDRWIASLERRR